MKVRWLFMLLGLVPGLAFGSIDTVAGPYRVSMETQPKVIPVGKAKLHLTVSDSSGKPLENLEIQTIARMPGMNMGEREQRANPVPGKPGDYTAEASFSMAGSYEVQVKITGAPGNATAVLRAATGQDTAGAAGFSIWPFIPWLIGCGLVLFVILRMRATGQRANWSAAFNRATMTGVLLIGALLVLAIYAVNNWRRPGSMTPIEAQVMEMNTPAPSGTVAVQLATVERGSVSETVSYSGQAVGFVEQDVNPRVVGVIVSMPVYVGDRVKKGQVLASLDTSQLDPQLAERAAMTNMAAEGVGVAAAEYQAALQEVAEARAEVGVREGGVSEAEAMLEAARQEKAAMEAEATAMQSDVSNALAEVVAAEETSRFRADELARMRQLYAQKAVSRSEVQQAEAESADAQARLRQAQSMVRSAESKLGAARANVKKADAMVAAAQRRVRQAQAEVRVSRAAVTSKQKAADAARQNISKERAAVQQARAGYQSAAAQRGYSQLKAEVDGVVTQRLVSPGTLVNPGQTVLKVAQDSPIRLQANVPVVDLERIKVGARVSIRSSQAKADSIQARISSVSPAVDPQSRTGVVEVLWPNANNRFLPGQFVTLDIELGESVGELHVPVEAIQRPPGNASPFVWIASASGQPGAFSVNRAQVQLGASDGKTIAVLSGLQEGQQVVTIGANSLSQGMQVSAPSEAVVAEGPVVEVYASGFKPDRIEARAGEVLTITFIRKQEEGCGTEVVFPDLKITKALPLNKPVEVTLRPTKTGELKFSCGMDMLRGKVVVR